MAVFTNIRGTSEPQFRISLSGPTTYHGTLAPTTGTPPSSEIYDELHEGDTYIQRSGVNSTMYIYIGPNDTDWVEFLVSGGTAPTITADLSVQGQFDTYDNIITLNSQAGAALVDGIGGMEVQRVSGSGETVQWIWNNSQSYWEARSVPNNPALNNVYVENDLSVGNSISAPDGSAVTPGISFTAGIGIYATATALGFSTGSSSRWTIDATGNFLPATTHNIGATGALAGNIYGTLFAGTDGAVGTPTFTFDSDTTTGMFTPAAGVIALSSGGSEVARVDATEMELQGTLKLTNGTSWTIDNDGSDSNKLKIAYSAVDEVVITTSGEILVGDGDTGGGSGPFVPSYSFLSDPTTGILLDTSDIVFTIGGFSTHLVISATAINAPAATVTDPKDLTTKEYVDAATGGSWREPVIVKEDVNYPDLSTAEGAMNTGSVDGISVVGGDRILYTDIITESKNIFIIDGVPGASATLVEDVNTLSVGDTVYVNEGSSENNVYSYNVNGAWSEISATSGFGGTLYFNYEVQTSTVSQTIFTLTGIKYALTSDGARLLVYVNGVKQVFSDAYIETNETTVTFNVGLSAGKTVEFYAVGLATDDGILKREEQTGLTGTPTITFTTITYVPTQDGLIVFLNGQKMIVDTNYTETDSITIDWITPSLVSTDVLEFYSSVPIVAGVNLEDISNVSSASADNGDIIVYSTTTGLWEQVAPGTSGIGMLYDDETDGLSGAIDGTNDTFTTLDVTVQSKTGTPGKRSYQLLYVNGVLQNEGGSNDYVVGFPDTITFNAGSIPQSGDTIIVYQL